MRHLFLLTFAFVFLLGVSTTIAQRRPPTSEAEQKQQIEEDKQAIDKLHDEDIEASIALDVPKLESLWTNDIVTIAPGGPAVVGREANAKKLEAQAQKLRSTQILGFNEQWQEVRIAGDWAYEWGTMSGRLQPFSGGKETDYKLNVMRILNRQPDGTWKIARSIYNNAEPEAKAPEPAKKPEKKKENELEQ